jgi:hypothetical protein
MASPGSYRRHCGSDQSIDARDGTGNFPYVFGGPRKSQGLSRASALAFLAMLSALIALALPALAGAASGYEVEGTGDGAKSVPGDECETTAGECTFRAAIEAANEEPDRDRIFFNSAVFHGDTGATLALGSALPPITEPLRIDATPCEVGQAPAFPCVPVTFPGTVGIDVLAGDTAVEGLIISGAEPGIRLSGAAAGNKVEGNRIKTPSLSNGATGILILNGPNDVFANEIEGTCCSSGILLQGSANGNRIGGDSTQSENVINGFQNGAIAMTLPQTSRNEVGRNRGLVGGSFIGLFKATGAEPGFPNQIDPPTIGSALQSSVTGTAKPDAKVRLFRKATGSAGEIKGFLGEATADGSGNWKLPTFGALPVGALLAATQTLGGGTSEVSVTATTAADPPPDNGGGGGTGGGGAGGGSCGSTGGQQGPPAPNAPAVAPRAKISAGPAGKIEATTARFRFTSPVAGSRFQCRLDGAKFSGCRSPRTYRNLKPGRHVFRVRVVGATGFPGPPVKRAFIVS